MVRFLYRIRDVDHAAKGSALVSVFGFLANWGALIRQNTVDIVDAR